MSDPNMIEVDIRSIAVEAGEALANNIIKNQPRRLPDEYVNKMLDNAGAILARQLLKYGASDGLVEAALDVMASAFEQRLLALERALITVGGEG